MANTRHLAIEQEKARHESHEGDSSASMDCGRVVTLARLLSANNSSYQQSVEKWRHDYENYLTADDGWLTVSGLFWLHEGENRFGSDPSATSHFLPQSAPASAGYLSIEGQKWLFI